MELATWAMDEFVGLALWGKADEVADKRADSEFAPLGFRDMHECFRPENTEVRDVRFVSTPSFFQCYTVKGLCGRNIVDVGGISKGVIPVGVRQLRVPEHGANPVEQGPVHAFSHTIVLQHVQGCYFVSNALVFEVVLQFAGDVLAPSIGPEGHDAAPCLNFSFLHERFEAFRNFRFEFDAVDEDLSRFVVNPCHEVNVIFM